jgi:hypothetical protein
VTTLPRDGLICSILYQLGYWIVEGLVDRTTEHYPRGGLKYLVCPVYPCII